MNHQQASLFDEPVAPMDRLVTLLGDKADNFVWWCRNGNRSMCEAVLRKEYQLSANDAHSLVDAVR